MKAIHDEIVRPIAEPHTAGAWYRKWRIVSLDGSTLDVADSDENAQAFARPQRAGAAALIRNFVSSLCWKMELMCCSLRAWEAALWVS
jgi:hypothetical protein